MNQLIGLSTLALVACGGKKNPPETAYKGVQTSTAVEVTVEVETYEVRGESAMELAEQMEDKGPRGSEGEAFDAYTTWWFSWPYTPVETDEGCEADRVSVTLKLTYEMPQATADQAWDSALTRKWRKFTGALWSHELGHGDLALARAEDLQKHIATLPAEADCDALRQVVGTLGDQAMETHNAAQRAYDDETSHGRTQGAVFP